MFRHVPKAITGILLAPLALGVFPVGGGAQTYWRVPGALAGAFTGAGVGYLLDVAIWSQESGDAFKGPSLRATSAGMVAGGLLGFLGGLNADNRLMRGDTLGRGARVTLRLATFLAPVAAGSAIAFAVINPSDEGRCVPYSGPDPNIICTFEPPKPKALSDESVALLSIGGGALTGWVLQHRFKGALWPRTRIGLAPGGRGATVSVSARW